MFSTFLRPARTTALAGALLALAACGGGGGSSAYGGVGTLRVALTDAPACGYDAVNVTIEKIRVHKSISAQDSDAGWADLTFAPARRVNLLTLTNGVLEELGQMALPTGRYTQIRLVLAPNGGTTPMANSVVPTGGSEVALTTPSGQQTGLKLNANVDVGVNQIADVVLDFDGCKSVVPRGNSGQYNLKPVIAVIPRVIDVGTIEGFVDLAIASGTTVSAQAGGAAVKATPPDPTTGKFVLYPVPIGSYSVVLLNPARATATVTGVPVVTAAPTALGAASAPLLPPAAASAPRVVTGTVATTPPSSAFVRALQTVASTPAPTSIEVGWTAADDVSGAFSLSLPIAAPVWAPFAASGAPIAFSADNAAAGLYTLQAGANGTTKTQAIDVKAAVPPVSFTLP
jgi:hypothetical protein